VQDQNLQTPGERHRHLGGDQLLESGRGMMIIESLADDFGWSRLPSGTGKVMWFALAIPPSVPRQDQAHVR
jgi:anti-sigma regulatory factor (Ser/Thr protein kinase)